eukprot:CAMPEP_0201717442 /NCGR_PEP_ID=MMETSP0593-20130828/3173_1 /ASSEMBLY_ACC=CAM_ASM_000672 /TAXON_ID=267983 /ORGANISM="Skeletonema japonicum, Strain CCMP2506" /LENGTH=92 /DNA_ID=CAMNT_0048207495 /DNA_START=31 /DNA_END=309 /DNA_ORIENTATION=-
MALLSLIKFLLTNFKYLLISKSLASSIFIFRNLANVGGATANSLTHDGYSSRGLAMGALELLAGSLEGGRMVDRPGMGVPGFIVKEGVGVLE